MRDWSSGECRPWLARGRPPAHRAVHWRRPESGRVSRKLGRNLECSRWVSPCPLLQEENKNKQRLAQSQWSISRGRGEKRAKHCHDHSSFKVPSTSSAATFPSYSRVPTVLRAFPGYVLFPCPNNTIGEFPPGESGLNGHLTNETFPFSGPQLIGERDATRDLFHQQRRTRKGRKKITIQPSQLIQ